MKAVAILALIFSVVSFFVPLYGVVTALGCSLVAALSFRWQPTISAVAIGINLISAAFFSPTLLFAEELFFAALPEVFMFGSMYAFNVGFHSLSMLMGIVFFVLFER